MELFKARLARGFEHVKESEKLYEVIMPDGERVASATNKSAVYALASTLNLTLTNWARHYGSDAVVG